LQEPSGIALIADEGGVVAGFVTGTVEPSGFYTRLLRRRWWRFALCCAVPLLRRPAIAPRLLRAFSVPGQNAHKQDRATLMSIAVTPECQGTGVGRALVKAFVLEALGRGRHCVDLTTDLENNRKVNNFYLRMGFVCERTFATPEGRAMKEYIISRSAANEGAFNLIPGQWPP
jgi:GNAT superfamily N-acetyltransferase